METYFLSPCVYFYLILSRGLAVSGSHSTLPLSAAMSVIIINVLHQYLLDCATVTRKKVLRNCSVIAWHWSVTLAQSSPLIAGLIHAVEFNSRPETKRLVFTLTHIDLSLQTGSATVTGSGHLSIFSLLNATEADNSLLRRLPGRHPTVNAGMELTAMQPQPKGCRELAICAFSHMRTSVSRKPSWLSFRRVPGPSRACV